LKIQKRDLSRLSGCVDMLMRGCVDAWMRGS